MTISVDLKSTMTISVDLKWSMTIRVDLKPTKTIRVNLKSFQTQHWSTTVFLYPILVDHGLFIIRHLNWGKQGFMRIIGNLWAYGRSTSEPSERNFGSHDLHQQESGNSLAGHHRQSDGKSRLCWPFKGCVILCKVSHFVRTYYFTLWNVDIFKNPKIRGFDR